MNFESVIDLVFDAFPPDRWPTPLARQTGDRRYLASLLRKNAKLLSDEKIRSKSASVLGSLLLGGAAETVFEELYSGRLSTSEISLINVTTSRNDTDYRLVNGSQRPIYRLNIKLHGSIFRKALDLVGLAPEDAFPLATYKINSALEKQNQEHLPYIFVVVTGTNFSAGRVAGLFSAEFVAAVVLGKAIIGTGKRLLEERLVQGLITRQPGIHDDIIADLRSSRWYVISARRAFETMKSALFERVFALRTRDFNRSYSNAEIDMHLSFAEDMTPLDTFLDLIRDEGHIKLAGMLERGTL